jgi:hypothetical protein
VKVYGAVPIEPVKVSTGADALMQTLASPTIIAVGKGLTDTVVLQVLLLPFTSVTNQVMDETPTLKVPLASFPAPLRLVAPVIAQ